MTALARYMDAWLSEDVERIAAAVAERCVITECYGPVYRGRETVRLWATRWFAEGGRVHGWSLTDRFATGDREVGEWVFDCTWQGRRSTFEGSSIARVADGSIVELREYQTTAPLYDWHGVWR